MKGLIVKKMADKFWVKTIQGLLICTARGKLKEKKLFVGDNVEINNAQLSIENVSPRKNLLIRPPLANLTQLFICLGDKPKPDFYILDKMLVFCKVNNIKPIICFTKSDSSQKNLEYLKSVYGKFYTVLETSAYTGMNIDSIKDVLLGQITAFAGQSGVGKSALVNAIFDEEKTQEGVLSQKIQRGKNTTRHCQIFELQKDCLIVDTPGFSNLSEVYLPISQAELPYYYPDFLQFLENCEYKSCTHIKENNCGIKLAVKNNLIDNQRYLRYTQIYGNLGKK